MLNNMKRDEENLINKVKRDYFIKLEKQGTELNNLNMAIEDQAAKFILLNEDMIKQDEFLNTKSNKIQELEKELHEITKNNEKLKNEIKENAIKVKTTTNHMSELQTTVQNLDNKIKQNKSKED